MNSGMVLSVVTTLWTSSLIASSAEAAYWDTVSFISGTAKTYVAPDVVGGSMQTFVFGRTTSGTLREDQALFSLHWAVEAGPGAPCVPLSGAQASSIETITDTMVTAWLTRMTSGWTLTQYQWRDFRGDFPRSAKTGAVKYSPTWRTTVKTKVGTDVGIRLPDQCSSTITLTTASRAHWGRSYIGGLSAQALGTFGRLGSAYVDGIADPIRTAFNSAVALPAITNPVVWSAQHAGVMSIRELHMDDVCDIQRRRRAKQVGYRKSYTA